MCVKRMVGAASTAWKSDTAIERRRYALPAFFE